MKFDAKLNIWQWLIKVANYNNVNMFAKGLQIYGMYCVFLVS